MRMRFASWPRGGEGRAAARESAVLGIPGTQRAPPLGRVDNAWKAGRSECDRAVLRNDLLDFRLVERERGRPLAGSVRGSQDFRYSESCGGNPTESLIRVRRNAKSGCAYVVPGIWSNATVISKLLYNLLIKNLLSSHSLDLPGVANIHLTKHHGPGYRRVPGGRPRGLRIARRPRQHGTTLWNMCNVGVHQVSGTRLIG